MLNKRKRYVLPSIAQHKHIGVQMGCVATYSDFQNIETQARGVNDVLLGVLKLIPSTFLVGWYSLALLIHMRSIFKATDNVFRCYKRDTSECQGCLGSIVPRFTELRDNFQKMHRMVEHAKFTPATKYVSQWAIDSLEDRLETLQIVADDELVQGLHGFLAALAKDERSSDSNWREKLNAL